jgi:outer membrane protein assembly factor BamD (BamD/ComL family)
MFPVSFIRSLLTLVVLAGFAAPLPVRAAEPVYEETGKTHSWLSLNRPARDNPTDQFAHARDLLDRERFKKAGKAFRALVTTWPGSPEAPLAQWSYARLLDKRGRTADAFEAYQFLMDTFPGRFPDYDKVLARQFEIAVEVMNTRKGKFLFLPGFEAPERAIPLFEQIIRNGPRSPVAAEAQYLIGKAYENSFQFELAVVAYMATLHRYPTSPFAEPAAFGRARSLYELSSTSPNDARALDEAWAGVMVYLRAFPDTESAETARTMRDALIDRKAQQSFAIGDYYDRIAKRPEAARKAYEEFLRSFPNSKWTETVRQRMLELEGATTPPTEDDHEQT